MIAGDPIAVVPLGFKNPDTCSPDPDCAAQLREDLAYAKGQSAYAARIAAAFAPCGFRAATNLRLINVGLERSLQNVNTYVWLGRPLTPETGPATLAAVDVCAAALARGDAGAPFARDDVSNWGSRLAVLTVHLTDLSGQPEPEPPLLLSWEDVAVDNWDGSGPTIVVANYRLDGGASARLQVYRQVPATAQMAFDAELAAAAQAWLATQAPGDLGVPGPVTARPLTSSIVQTLVDGDPTRMRYLVYVDAPGAPSPRDVGIAVTHDFATGANSDFRLVTDVVGPDGIERMAVLDQ